MENKDSELSKIDLESCNKSELSLSGVSKDIYGYLLPKEHPLHIPPHVALVKMEAEVESIRVMLRDLDRRNEIKDRAKKFEGSWTRILFIMFITYLTLMGYMYLIDVPYPYLNAVVPTVGFNLSTWSLPHIKKLWLRWNEHHWNNNN
mmetsp:Transcript_28423/g.28731  ORF Transcript_28423/g.28731 Transcript_28423/m.28731 type:complete len:147 (-) Transcript_28423:46-486(-)|eukprot:CAMPEP_0182430524 /NCGR_PEP_ID=MMETSP1167-20130531/41365_1 /TAXON_ID=2988 /ORGANISM="Mallomonas Sp, Strain CCMP3275" /LENGTH=146 /DNA_ID=CAMNT_0024615733 /DNA_START=314 /DNA_END=754 /DNA_ORIENTATION=+